MAYFFSGREKVLERIAQINPLGWSVLATGTFYGWMKQPKHVGIVVEQK